MPKRPGLPKRDLGPPSTVLEEEAKKMEEQLSQLKNFMEKEKELRDVRRK